MRVIAGEVKGFQLKGPASRGTRPMTDKIKGALFSMMSSLGIEPDRVLDLYAGTGSLGIEALSRWASEAEFVEQNAAARAVIRDNLAHTGYADVSKVHGESVETFIARAKDERTKPFDLVILDPPYADPHIVEVLERIGESRLVQSGTFVAIGHSPRVKLPDELGRLVRLRERCHGDSCFSIYEVIAEPDTNAAPTAEEHPNA